MATFGTNLDLVNAVLEEVDEDRLDTLAGSTEPVVMRAQKYVNLAYEDICNDGTDWPWLRLDQTLTTTAGVSEYAPGDGGTDAATDFENISLVQVSGEKPIDLVPYSEYSRITGGFGATSNGTPYLGTVKNGKLVLFPTPQSALAINIVAEGEYTAMSEDDDEPLLPAKYRSAIYWRALAFAKSSDHEETTEWAKSEAVLSKIRGKQDNSHGGYSIIPEDAQQMAYEDRARLLY
jgi:hypothetical protein